MKFTKFIRFALTASLFNQVRKEAKQRKISASELIRRALEHFLYVVGFSVSLRRNLGTC
jgi:Arc/MetJ-type ribon-helix-helix transcriptional regulator